MNEQQPHPHWRDEVRLRESARARHVRLRIDRRGRVELVVPRGFDPREAPAILTRHQAWVEKTLHRMAPQLRAMARPERLALTALGHEWALAYHSAGRVGYRETGAGQLSVLDDTAWPQHLRRWLASQGRRHLLPWLAAVSEEIGLPYAKVSIRGQKTRWGSCSARGNINLNYALLLLPPEQVRYLLIHELCHTVHLNHSRAYWRLVERHCPDYRIHDRALRGAMAQLPLWLHD